MGAFEKSVFVNCPFDEEYLSLFRPLIFTILYLGLKPRIAFERSDSGETRIDKILELIGESRFGIHDLSRCQAARRGEFFRLNMPLELGIDFGCRVFRSGRWRSKRFLILEQHRFRFQKAISDLSGSDIKAHKNDPNRIIRVIRDWLVQEAGAPARPPTEIRARFTDFMAGHFEMLVAEGYSRHDIKVFPLHELTVAMERWIAGQRI